MTISKKQSPRVGELREQSEELVKPRLLWVTNANQQDLDNGRVTHVNGVVGEPYGATKRWRKDCTSRGMVGIYRREGDRSFRIVSTDPDFNWALQSSIDPVRWPNRAADLAHG
jgi:hypothetical protein